MFVIVLFGDSKAKMFIEVKDEKTYKIRNLEQLGKKEQNFKNSDMLIIFWARI